MAIFITGDTHGDFSRLLPAAFHEQRDLTKEDCLIICGDFGGIWDGGDAEQQWLDWLETRSFTTLFVSGNHENYDLLRNYPISQWHGGLVQAIRPSVLHLMRGQLYNICGKRIFTMGGASSHDIRDGILEPDNPDYERKLRQLNAAGALYRAITAPGGKRSCPARTNTGPQEKHWTKQVGTWTTSSPIAAPAVSRTPSVEDCTSEMR